MVLFTTSGRGRVVRSRTRILARPLSFGVIPIRCHVSTRPLRNFLIFAELRTDGILSPSDLFWRLKHRKQIMRWIKRSILFRKYAPSLGVRLGFPTRNFPFRPLTTLFPITKPAIFWIVEHRFFQARPAT